ncbi:MAG: DUF2298 domain-containing protein [Candidatus Aenigmatarchaeota archaeon]
MIYEIFVWWLITEILGLSSLPILLFICKKLPDRGYSISKIVGILLVSYFTWILTISQLFKYDVLVIIVSIFFTIFISIIVFLHDRECIIIFLKKRKKTILWNEIVFLSFFILFTSIRMFKPDIYTLEKYMDFAFINGINRSEKLPPLDPWFSGGDIKYYYFGHFIVVTLTKLSGLPTHVTYNLAFSLFYSLFTFVAFGIGYNLTQKYRYALITVILISFVGNIFGFLQLITFLFPSFGDFLVNTFDLKYPVTCCWNPSLSFTQQIKSMDVWASTRIIPNTINEFPYSSFLFGDLHAHYMAFPFQLLVLTLFLNFFLNERTGNHIFDKDIIERSINIFLLSLSVGSLSFISSWYYPTSIILFIFMIFSILIGSNKKIKNLNFIRNIIILVLVIVILSILLFLPFFYYNKPYREIGFVKERTNIFHFLIIFSPFHFLTFSFLHLNSKKLISQHKWKILISFLSSVFLSFFLNFQLLLVLVPIFIFSPLLLFSQRKKDHIFSFVVVLILVSALIVLFSDIMFIDSRMNTVFKMYLQVWNFLAIASGYALYDIERYSFPSKIWYFFFYFLLFASLFISFVVTFNQIIFGLEKGPSLDGMLYMKTMENGDYEAIRWLNKNINGSPVVLEAPGKAYTYYSRVSTNTGLPTVIGWLNHEFLWRGKWYSDREEDINRIYTTINNTEAIELLNKYNVTYIYVGSLEHKDYPSDGLKKFSNFPDNYRLIYDNLNVQIYQFIK